MKKFFRLASVLSLLLLLTPVAASAAKPSVGGSQQSKVGNDISFPQCGRSLPTNHAFGIVGVNGGNAANTNPCLSEQLIWASKATGVTSQPKVQLYVNTANPGEVIYLVSTWPTNNTDQTGFTTSNPYGICSGTATNDLPCSWQYGWNRSVDAVTNRFTPAALAAGMSANPQDYKWWLDVETENTWQSGSIAALARNTAALEGFLSYYAHIGAKIGIYSTGYQWGVITGNTVGTNSVLNYRDNWLAGAITLKGAQRNCSNAPLTLGSKVVLSQYVFNNLDYDYSCVN